MKLVVTALVMFILLPSCKMMQRTQEEAGIKEERSGSNSRTELTAEQIGDAKIKPGRYLGYLKMKDRDVSLPFVIELVAYRYNEKFYKLRSVVKILHGGYQSHEYTAEYFQHVDYKLSDGSFIFKGSQKKIQIEEAKLHNDIIVGKLALEKGQFDGKFFVEWQSAEDANLTKQAMLASYSVAPNITGSYVGSCNAVRKEIQLEVFREMSEGDRNQLDWRISGRIGDADKKDCKSKDNNCQNDELTNIDYNLKDGKLELVTKGEMHSCKLTTDGIDCDTCKYKKLEKASFALTNNKKYKIKPREFHMALSKKENKPARNKLKEREGEYYGYLHHETSDRYQLVRLKIQSKTVKNSKGVDWDYLSGTSSLFFGKNKFSEFAAYEFQPRRYVSSRPVYVFDGGGESFFAATHWSSKSVEGIWYSKNFGRVGTVELVKGRIPFISEKAEFIPPIGGQYDNNSGQFQLVARSSKSESFRDFFPLSVFGWAVDRRFGKKRSVVTSGNYDFYSGVVSLSLEDGRRVFGNFSANSARFFWPTQKKSGVAMANHRTRKFVLKEIPRDSNVMESINGLVIEKSLGKNYFVPNRIKKGFKRLPEELKIETNVDNYFDEEQQY